MHGACLFLQAMQSYAWAHNLLQTILGINQFAAAPIIVETGEDKAYFGSPALWAA